MSGYSIDTLPDRVVPASGELDTIWRPRTPRVGGCGVILLHGQGNPQGFIDPNGQRFAMEVAATITSVGIPCISAEMHGDAWAKDIAMDDMESSWTVLSEAYPIRLDKIILMGISMGGSYVARYSQLHPSAVAAAIGVIPAFDPKACYINSNVGDFAMEEAWDFSGLEEFPDALDLAATADLAKRVPLLSAYSSDDPVVPSDSVIAYHSAAGGIPENLIDLGDQDHGFNSLPLYRVVRFMLENGA